MKQRADWWDIEIIVPQHGYSHRDKRAVLTYPGGHLFVRLNDGTTARIREGGAVTKKKASKKKAAKKKTKAKNAPGRKGKRRKVSKKA